MRRVLKRYRQRRRIRVQSAQPPREHPSDQPGTRGEPGQPAPHRRSRAAQPGRDLPVTRTRRARRQPCPDHRRPIRPPQQAAHRQQHMRAPTLSTPRPPRAQPPADPACPADHPLPGMPPPRQPTRARRAAQPPRRQPPLDHARINAYRDHWCLRAPRAALPLLGQEKGGRAAAYPDVITVASHTKKDNPAGLPSSPSLPPTAPGSPYVLTPNAGGHPTAKAPALLSPQAARPAHPRLPGHREVAAPRGHRLVDPQEMQPHEPHPRPTPYTTIPDSFQRMSMHSHAVGALTPRLRSGWVRMLS